MKAPKLNIRVDVTDLTIIINAIINNPPTEPDPELENAIANMRVAANTQLEYFHAQLSQTNQLLNKF